MSARKVVNGHAAHIGHPCLAYASALFMAGQRAAYEPPLHIAEQLFRDEGNRHGLGRVFALRAIAARPRGDAVQAIEWGSQALELLPEQDLVQRSVSLSAVGTAYLLTGNVPAAEQTLTEAAVLSERAGNINNVLTDTLERSISALRVKMLSLVFSFLGPFSIFSIC
jgi:ATP/maltotriose-dependent transcriptional regulator MalT